MCGFVFLFRKIEHEASLTLNNRSYATISNQSSDVLKPFHFFRTRFFDLFHKLSKEFIFVGNFEWELKILFIKFSQSLPKSVWVQISLAQRLTLWPDTKTSPWLDFQLTSVFLNLYFSLKKRLLHLKHPKQFFNSEHFTFTSTLEHNFERFSRFYRLCLQFLIKKSLTLFITNCNITYRFSPAPK